MSLTIHPSAEEHFNAEAAKVAAQIEEVPESYFEDKQTPFPSEIIPDQEIGPESIKGSAITSEADPRGRRTAVFFSRGNKTFGIRGKAYSCLSALVENVSNSGNVSRLLSRDYIREKLVKWLIDVNSTELQDKPFISYLKQCASQDIGTRDVFVPLAHMEVEIEFAIGNSYVTPLSKEKMDEWAQGVSTLHGVTFDVAKTWLAKIEKSYQGLAAIRSTIQSEPGLAVEVSLGNAKQAISALALFSPAILIPDIRCISMPVGNDSIRHYSALMRTSNGEIAQKCDVDDAPMGPSWQMDKAQIDQNMDAGLRALSEIFEKEKRSGFEATFVNFINIYSRAAFTADPLDKLVYALSGLETLLLRNASEAIQQNLGERMAILIGRTLEERKNIVETVRSVYGIRSNFLHHGKQTDQIEKISRFLRDARLVFRGVLANVPQFHDKKDFILAIDDEKLRPKG